MVIRLRIEGGSAERNTPPTADLNLHDFCTDKSDGIHKDPLDCDHFIDCANGKTFVFHCPPGTVFNHAIENCDIPRNVPSCGKGGSQTTNVQGYCWTIQKLIPWFVSFLALVFQIISKRLHAACGRFQTEYVSGFKFLLSYSWNCCCCVSVPVFLAATRLTGLSFFSFSFSCCSCWSLNTHWAWPFPDWIRFMISDGSFVVPVILLWWSSSSTSCSDRYLLRYCLYVYLC